MKDVFGDTRSTGHSDGQALAVSPGMMTVFASLGCAAMVVYVYHESPSFLEQLLPATVAKTKAIVASMSSRLLQRLYEVKQSLSEQISIISRKQDMTLENQKEMNRKLDDVSRTLDDRLSSALYGIALLCQVMQEIPDIGLCASSRESLMEYATAVSSEWLSLRHVVDQSSHGDGLKSVLKMHHSGTQTFDGNDLAPLTPMMMYSSNTCHRVK